ncbi:TonB-denpendent receptor [Pseudomonas sp. JV551A1]|uniref:TonB-denpendent receptor n=1 Tax=Pseudomonas inefficax TaxID=2078786 RepID=A0AAQ1PCK1_9PSED|nr:MULTISPECIES: TonB-dependent receptor [Pseudomonas]SPO56381.1 TonB-denpendent receptor [Pseudomonas sp. JV551A1]SPO61868.1 TonB-denpendent receptor [Pseudomonas inefficax]
MRAIQPHPLRLAIRHAALATAATALLAPVTVLAAEQTLGTVTVQAAKQSEVQQAASALAEVPGGTSVVDSEEVAKGRTATLQDTLGYQPGVFVQSTGGNDAAKISIRGSGANTSPGYFREGIKFLFDGLPLTGPGGTPYEFLNASGVNYTEILRGANAFQYGALTLGGAVNFVNHSGYSAPGLRVRAEAGSYHYQKQSISYGGVEGDLDYYLQADNYRNEGFRDYSLSKSSGIVANAGYRFSPKLETRLLLRYRDETHNDPSATTLNAALHHPRRASATAESSGAGARRPGSIWVGSKTTYTFDDDARLTFGLSYHDYRHTNSPRSPSNPSYWDWHDLGLLLGYDRVDYLFGHESRSNIAFTSTQHLRGGVNSANDDKLSLKQVNYKDSFDRVIALGNDINLVDNLWLTSGVSFINVRRKINIDHAVNPNTTTFPQHVDYDNWSVAPRIGLRYEFSPNLQVFTNFSRSIDPPASWEYSGSGPALPYIRPLVEQKANTFEVGIKGSHGIFDGSLALYRSWIHDELLNVQIIPATSSSAAVTGAFNASPTIHQGVEAGLNTRLWENPQGDLVRWRQVYTYNDFYYRHDDRFGDNQLPGVPKHIYQGELQYQDHSGWYTGINVQSASRTAVDYANSLYAPSYTIWGANLGYEAPKGNWKVSLDLKNLANKAYVTAVTPVYNARGQDTASFWPGDGIGAYVGVEYRY